MSARRRIRGTAALLAMLAGLLLALPAVASAKTFTVNVINDNTGTTAEVIDGVCDADNNAGNGLQCELRGAVAEANATGAADTIKFDPAFNGELGDVIQLSNAGGRISLGNGPQSVTIDGGDCPDGTFNHKPCVEVRGAVNNTERTFSMGSGETTIRGLAITNGHGGGLQVGAGQSLKVTNSWFGVNLDGATLDVNDFGITVESLAPAGQAVIGGTSGKDRNVFAGGMYGLRLRNTDDGRVKGNYFGVMPDGVTPSPSVFANNAIDVRAAGEGNTADGTVIGASIDSAHRATTKCDGGCNVIANANGGAGSAGIHLQPTENPASHTTIKGNFIGLDAIGTSFIQNARGIDTGQSTDTTIGGATSAERNFLVCSGITSSGTEGLEVKRNFIGLNSAGTAEVEGCQPLIRIDVDGGDPALVSRNRMTGDLSGTGIRVNAAGTRVVRNKIGLDKNGGGEDGPGTGILVLEDAATIGEPGAGNVIGNTDDIAIQINGGDNGKVQGNFLGVDPAGVAHENFGGGVELLNDADDNVIGGTSGATENVISNSDGDAIEISNTGGASAGNQIKRNRGKDNGGLFIDLGNDGFGNGTAVNNMIEAPEITNDVSGDVTRTHIEGTDANPNATIYIFRTSAPADASPNRINAFVKTTTANASGEFSTNFSKIPSGQQLTVLQLVPGDTNGSSELALAVAPPGP